MLVAPLTTPCSKTRPSVLRHSNLICPAALNRGAQLVCNGPRSHCGSRWHHNTNSRILQILSSPNPPHRIAVGRSPGTTCVTAAAVALDVEYAHYRTAEGRHVSLPAWVALVDEHCTVLLKAHISQKVSSNRVSVGWGLATPAVTGLAHSHSICSVELVRQAVVWEHTLM